jgi:hypothetical protein
MDIRYSTEFISFRDSSEFASASVGAFTASTTSVGTADRTVFSLTVTCIRPARRGRSLLMGVALRGRPQISRISSSSVGVGGGGGSLAPFLPVGPFLKAMAPHASSGLATNGLAGNVALSDSLSSPTPKAQ